MRVLIIGGTGFIGSRLVTALAGGGAKMTVLSLATGKEDGCRYLIGDRNDARVLDALLDTGPYDCVIDLIAYHDWETKAMIGLWEGRVGRFVHLSTASVIRDFSAPNITEDSAILLANESDGYGAGKAACEHALALAHQKTGFPFVALRCAPLMGPGDPVSRENYLLKRLLLEQPIIAPKPLNGYVPLVYVNDVVSAIVGAVYAEAGVGKAYIIAQKEELSFIDHIRAIAELAGKQPSIRTVARESLLGRDINIFGFPFMPLPKGVRFDTEAARRDLGFESTPYDGALKETIDWLFERDPISSPAWPGSGTKQSRLAGTHETLHLELERRLLDSDEGRRPTGITCLDPDEILQRITAYGGRELILSGGRRQSVERFANTLGHDAFFIGDKLLNNHVVGACFQAGEIDRPALQAVIEPDDTDETGSTAWLYSRQSASRSTGYRHSHQILKIRLVPFSPNIDKNRGPGERFVAYICNEATAQAFLRWLEACKKNGFLLIASLAGSANVFLSGACGDLYPGNFSILCAKAQTNCVWPETSPRTRRALVGAARPWVHIFDIVRFIHRSNPEAEDTLIEVSGRGRFITPLKTTVSPKAYRERNIEDLFLLKADEDYFLYDFNLRRLFAVNLSTAILFEVWKQAPNHQESVLSSAKEVLGIPESTATELLNQATEHFNEMRRPTVCR